jgi:homoserine kinase type II
MGVKTPISLDDINTIFPAYCFIDLHATSSGIIDTTYIAHTQSRSYVLKKYEREIQTKIAQDTELLHELKSVGLNVPTCLDENSGWYLYEKLQGKQPKVIKTYHIQALARFLAKLHKQTYKKSCDSNIKVEDEVTKALNYTKSNHYSYYKRFEFLKNFTHKNDGLIHGDIFKDNTVFDDAKVGVFDFIDSTCGSFAFDVAVALVGFDTKIHNHYFINLFLRSYNQHAPSHSLRKKINKKDILKEMEIASSYYALKRVYKYKNTSKAKELIRYI